ncbi:MAG: S8 family serine peptidase [Chitinophagaceae bacterium]
MKPRPFLLLFFSFFIFLSSLARQSDRFQIRLISGSVTPAPNISDSKLKRLDNSLSRVNGKSSIVIQFETLPDSASKARLTKTGYRLISYLSGNAYMAAVEGKLDQRTLKAEKVRAVLQLEGKQKMTPGLAAGQFPPRMMLPNGQVRVWVSVFPFFELSDVQAQLLKHGVTISSAQYSVYRIFELQVDRNKLEAIAGLPFIEFVQPAPGADVLLNDKSIGNSRANILQSVSGLGRGLTGQGIVLGVGDNGTPTLHVDMRGRYYDHAASPGGTHGIHVMGTMAGAGIRDERFTGYAPHSKFVTQLMSNILVFTPQYISDYGMTITNNSYGNVVDDCADFGTYNLYSNLIDQQINQYPSLMHVFAAGNSGSLNCAPYSDGFGNVLGGYQSSKNAIDVGNTTEQRLISVSSSKGPVKDGRIKPEITAQGTRVYSTSSNNTYNVNSGTSMAAPAVSGGLALLYQRHAQLNGGALPPNYLAKALLCNGATDLGLPGPDFSYGFGWLNLLKSVTMLENQQYFLGTVRQAESFERTIQLQPGSTLKVMLCWNDPAAAPLAAAALVNDLDLVVTGPDGVSRLPLVADHRPGFEQSPAVPKVDRINNIEQVVIPIATGGIYRLQVRGERVAFNNSQDFALVFDTVVERIAVTYPIERSCFATGDSTYIRWEALSTDSRLATIEYSINNGANWVAINSGVPLAEGQLKWFVPTGIASSQALIRVLPEGTSEPVLSGQFTISGRPQAVLSPVQCDSYIQVNWPRVIGVDAYEVLVAGSDQLRSVGITTDSFFVIAPLATDTTYVVSIRAIINGTNGPRSFGLLRAPTGGTCAGNLSNGDLKMESVIAPVSGRKFTSRELTNQARLTIRFKNLDDAFTVGNIPVAYQLNGGIPVTATINNPNLRGGASLNFTFPGFIDLSAVGDYQFKCWIAYPGDPHPENDTIVATIRHLDNPILDISIPFIESFEALSDTTFTKPQIGLGNVQSFDFVSSTTFGRLRSKVIGGFAKTGNRSLTLDLATYRAGGNIDSITGTFNLSNYDVATEDVRLDFQFMHHGQLTHPANQVWVRGSDQHPWLPVYDLDANPTDAGLYLRTPSLEISDLLALNGQQLTGSFQVRWGQWGQYITADRETAAGYTFDDIRLYSVVDDIQMLTIDTPVLASCGLDAATPIRVTVRNSANTALSNIPVSYRIGNQAVVTETIPAIAGNTSIQFEFAQKTDLSELGNHTLSAWVSLSSDNFRDNDTSSVTIRNLPVISGFPYLQDFEQGTGNWFGTGKKSSWEWGTPQSIKIRSAASGSKAWKTTLVGTYNDAELSYLYSPCFDLSGMVSPMLSFSMALDIEDCGATTQCDAAWVEYSTDGRSWQRLGSFGTGVNWYNRNYTEGPVWSKQDYTNWHVASTLLPAGVPNLRLRFVMKSDPYVSREGVAIDDIHIFDRSAGIFNDPVLVSNIVSENANSDDWIPFYDNGKIMAALHTGGLNLGSAAVTTHLYDGAVRDTNSSYYLNRNFAIATNDDRLADSVDLRLYFTDLEVKDWIAATGCTSCPQPVSAYQLGVAQYAGSDRSEENGTIDDNTGTRWWWIPNSRVRIVPYDIGYYAEFKVGRLSEFWLSAGRLDGVPAPSVSLQSFTATLGANQQVHLEWNISPEFNMDYYQVEMARGNDAFAQNQFEIIGELLSQGNTGAIHSYDLMDSEPGKTGVRYYRIRMVGLDGSVTYSDVKAVMISAEIEWQLYPNPSSGSTWVMYQLNEGEKWQATIYDLQGRRVLRREFTGSGFVQKLEWNLSSLAPGLYLVEMSGPGVKKTVKLVRQ